MSSLALNAFTDGSDTTSSGLFQKLVTRKERTEGSAVNDSVSSTVCTHVLIVLTAEPFLLQLVFDSATPEDAMLR